MNRIKGFQLAIPMIVLGLVACFGGVKKTGKVVGYQPGKVITKKGFYNVGQLPPDWVRMLKSSAMVAFRNSEQGSSIATDAFCDQAYDDASLNMLTRHLFAGLQELKVVKEEPFDLDGRGALRTVFDASLDGVPVKVDAVVIKKNWCLFDFYLVTSETKYGQVVGDFETFFRGFAYSGEI